VHQDASACHFLHDAIFQQIVASVQPNGGALREGGSVTENEAPHMNEPNAFAIFPRAQPKESAARGDFHLVGIGIRTIRKPEIKPTLLRVGTKHA
jgi:hypothetical protein